MTVRFLHVAEDEGFEAAFWYENQRPGLGGEFQEELDKAWKAIGVDPKRYPLAEMPRSKREIRYYQLNRFPYAVYFEVRADEVMILAVAHTARRPFYWKRRK